MTKIKQLIQGNADPDVFTCYCGEYLYLRIQADNEDSQMFIAITGRAKTLKERLGAAFRCLLGKEFYVSDEVVIDGRDLPSLRKALTLKKVKNG